MKSNSSKIFLIVLIISVFISSGVFAQKKLAQTGFQFLSVAQDARAIALGDAYTTVEGMPNGLFYNPASIVSFNGLVGVSANYFEWIADINHMSFALALNPMEGQYGVIGVSVQAVDYGDLQGTMVWENPQGYVDTEIFNPSALAIGLGYGRMLTEKFMVGGQIKFVSQNLGKSVIPGEAAKSNVADVFAFDFGTIYKTGFRSLSFGMSVRNFSQEIKYEEEGFQLPLTFKIGVSIDAMDFILEDQDKHGLLVIFDAAHPRSYPEYLNLGTEYTFMNTFAVRVGYVTNQDEYDFTAGFGIKQFGVGLDYAYTPFGVFDNVHRFSFNFSY